MYVKTSQNRRETHSPQSRNQLFAAFIRQRRMQLCLNTEDAARLAGLYLSQWIALETGWIPDMRSIAALAIAGTLQTRVDDLALLAVCSAQDCPDPLL
jgi:hypothetical protein